MKATDEQQPLFPININNTFALRRNIRIVTSKLPADFFKISSSKRYGVLSKQNSFNVQESSRNIRTPSFQVRKYNKDRRDLARQSEREVVTARPSLQKGENPENFINRFAMSSQRLKEGQYQKSIHYKNISNLQERLPIIRNRFLKQI